VCSGIAVIVFLPTRTAVLVLFLLSSSFMSMVVQVNRPQIDPYAVLVSAGVAGGSLIALQLLTTADPIGRCVTFWKQLRRQVRAMHTVQPRGGFSAMDYWQTDGPG
jgi:hypothetical protein